MNTIKLSLLVITFATCACNSQKTSKKSPGFAHFDVEKELKEQQLYQLKDINPMGLLLLNDSLLLVRNASDKSPTHFTSWNTRQKKIAGTYLPVGRKPGQSLSFLSYGLFNNNIWVNDIMKDKIIVVDAGRAPIDSQTTEYGMPVFYYSVQILDDGTIVGTGDYDSDYKISRVNLTSGKLIDQMIPYKSKDGPVVPREEKMAYESFLFVRPSGEKCVLACRYADQIEIVDLNRKTSKIVSGPEGYAPDVMVATGNDGKKLSTRNEDTRYAFVKGKTTKNFIYLLYSGNNNLSEHLDYGGYLYIYDWDGKPVQKLKFSDDVLDFAVTADDKTIYTYHPRSKSIAVSNLF